MWVIGRPPGAGDRTATEHLLQPMMAINGAALSLLALALVIVVLGRAATAHGWERPGRHCGRNEVEGCAECGEPRCSDILKPAGPPCRTVCKNACVCRDGFHRQGEKCVSAEECKVRCPENMKYDSNAQEPETCDSLSGRPGGPGGRGEWGGPGGPGGRGEWGGPGGPRGRGERKPRCVCKDDYYWQDERCVPGRECRVQCPENMKFDSNAPEPETCDSLSGRPGGRRDRPELKPRCVCRDGLYWQDKKCVSVKECRVQCLGNMIFDSNAPEPEICGSHNWGPGGWGHGGWGDWGGRRDRPERKPRCTCGDGLVLIEKDSTKCVRRSECPRRYR